MTDEQPQYLEKQDTLVRLAGTKYKEILREVLAENNRKGNFIRIYPAKGSDFYDQFFENPRPYNRYVYKMLYSDYFEQTAKGTSIHTNEPTITPIGDEQVVRRHVTRSSSKKIRDSSKKVRESSLSSIEQSVSPELKRHNVPELQTFNFYSYEDNMSQPNMTIRDSSAENRNCVSPFKSSKTRPKKVKVNPEDILVEYVERVMKLLKQFVFD